jgi:hypothetical protein
MSEDPLDEKTSMTGLLRQFEEAGIPVPESPSRAHHRLSRYAGIYPLPNLAVEVCDRMFADAAKQAVEEGKSTELTMYAGKLAYCSVMPKLSGSSNIRDFIACVAYAMMLGIIPGAEGTRLLYAAQVAHAAHTNRRKKSSKTPLKSTPLPAVTREESEG